MLSYNTCKKLSILVYIAMFFVPDLVNGTDVGGIKIPDKLFAELYSSYKDSLNIDEGTVSFRRVFADNKKYQIHVMKLTEVNGNKRHNLMVKEDNSTNPLIYIDNPVETKIPNAYLTFEEFKKELTERVLKLREEFVATASKTKAVTNSVKWKPMSKKKEPDQEVRMLKLYLDGLDQSKKDNKTNILTNDKKANESTVFHIKTKLEYVSSNTAKKAIKKTVFRSKTTLGAVNSDITIKENKFKKRPVLRIKKVLKSVKPDTTKKENIIIKRPVIHIKTTLEALSAGTTLNNKIIQNLESATNVTVPDQNIVNKGNDKTTESLTNVTVETSLETPPMNFITGNPIEPQVAIQESIEKPEPTLKYKIDLTTISTTEAIISNEPVISNQPTAEAMTLDQPTTEAIMKPKRTSLSKPLVWMGGS